MTWPRCRCEYAARSQPPTLRFLFLNADHPYRIKTVHNIHGSVQVQLVYPADKQQHPIRYSRLQYRLLQRLEGWYLSCVVQLQCNCASCHTSTPTLFSTCAITPSQRHSAPNHLREQISKFYHPQHVAHIIIETFNDCTAFSTTESKNSQTLHGSGGPDS